MSFRAIELAHRAYEVFAKYPKKLRPTVASFEAEIELRKRVKHTRLREISCADIEIVWWSATGDEAALKHFLPRVIECIACRQGGSITLRDVQERLKRIDIAAWPEDERAIVDQILRVPVHERRGPS